MPHRDHNPSWCSVHRPSSSVFLQYHSFLSFAKILISTLHFQLLWDSVTIGTPGLGTLKTQDPEAGASLTAEHIQEYLGSIWAPTSQPEREKGKETETKERTIKECAFSLPHISLPFLFLFLLSQNNLGPYFLGSGTRLVKHKADVRNTRATQRTQNGRRRNNEMVSYLPNTKALLSNCRLLQEKSTPINPIKRAEE